MQRNNEGNIGCFAMGCLGAIATCIILAVVVMGAGFYMTDRFLKQFTDTEPVELPAVTMAEADFPAVEERLNNFLEALDSDQPAEPLTLTEDEVNGLLYYDEDFKPFGEYIRLDIAEEGKVRGEISLPLHALEFPSSAEGASFDFLAYGDRYLNGKGELEVFLRNGRLYIHPLAFEIKGEPVPSEFMDGVRNENMVEWVDPEGNAEPITGKIDRIEFGENTLTLVPKAPSQDAAEEKGATTEEPADPAAAPEDAVAPKTP